MKTIITIILLLVADTVIASNSNNCFPGKKRTFSPSHQYEFIWRERKDDNDSHHLLFRKTNTKDEAHELLLFEREVCIHWSPDEKYFSISDYVVSNIAEVYIYKSDNATERVNVRDLLPSEVAELFRGISHGYLETTSWDKRGLIIRAWGDRNKEPREFDINLKCNFKNRTWICQKVGINKSTLK
jgi:hypothetical protein